MHLLSSLVVALSFSLSVAAWAAQGQGQGKKKEDTAASTATPPVNACGCYEDSSGQCHCVKKNRCGCPGACEPAGCEDKRRKQLEREAQLELRKQQLEEKKRNAEMEKKQAELEEKEAAKREKSLRGLRLVEEK